MNRLCCDKFRPAVSEFQVISFLCLFLLFVFFLFLPFLFLFLTLLLILLFFFPFVLPVLPFFVTHYLGGKMSYGSEYSGFL